MINLDQPEVDLEGKGHYEDEIHSWQCRVLSVEEEASPYHQLLQSFNDLGDSVLEAC